MKLEHRADVQDFYDLSSLCNNDLNVVASLICLMRLKPTKRVLNNLEDLKLTSHKDDISFLLDNLQVNTFKNISKAMQIRKAKDEH